MDTLSMLRRPLIKRSIRKVVPINTAESLFQKENDCIFIEAKV